MAQQITVSSATTNADVQNYVENVLLGSCVTASNITFSGTAHAAGTFDGTGTVLGLNEGVILTTGQSLNAVGPDNGNSVGFGNGGGGDPDLESLASGFTTYDASILEFDFVPQSDTLRFNYIFGSEEYPEYVNSGYNDVFGFFISGPGIAGPYTGGAENIALIPGTGTPVAIDNVNNGYSGTEPSTGPCNNCAYYVDNSSGPAVEYDGHTTVLTAEVVVTPCETYHIKIAIADAGDGALDSGVFLEAGSFSASGEDAVELEAISGVSGVYEGCDIGSFVFRRLPGSSNNTALTVGYNVSGTATPGTDYTALPGSITIPAGQDSVVLNIEGVLDFTPEGTETVVLDLVGGGCTCTAPPSVSMDILDNDIQLSLSTTGTTTICLGESANLVANPSGSITPYTSGWDNGAPAGDNITVSPTQTTTYTYTLVDACSGQQTSSSETVTVVRPDFTVDDDEQCFPGNTFSFVNTGASGGTVSHFWEFGDGNDSSVENPTYSYAAAGTYTVTHYVIYTAAGCTASTDAIINVFDEPSVLAIVNQNVSCVGGSDGELGSSVSGGTAPISYLWSPNGETTPGISGLSVGNYTITVTDANGCTDAVTAPISQNDSELPIALCQDVTVTLNGSGVATLSAAAVDNGSSDNCGIASLVVSPNVFSCSEFGANPVTLTVTDVNGNVATCNATVTVEDPVPPTALCQDVSVTLDAFGNASVDASQIDNGSTDNCAIQSITLSPNSFTCADLGPTQVTLTVTDEGGNVSTCDATVTVIEDTDPTAVCQDITVQLDATGNVSVTGAQVGGGSTDNCGVVDITVNPSDFTCADIGANTATVTVSDANVNTATCSAIITVEDNLAPDAVCQDIQVYLDASGNVSITASDVDGGSTDNCAIDSISATPTSFSCADVGPNAVDLTVVDVNGNTASCTATVTVEDTISPTAVCQDITVQLDANGMASIVAADIDNGSVDNCGSPTILINPTTFDCTASSPAQVELTVADASGNSSTCSAIVTLEETTPPTAVCDDITIQLDASGNANIIAADIDGGSTDNCGVVDTILDISTFDCADIGPNTVTLTVVDANGNQSTCTAIVTVEETVPPIAVCQDIVIQLNASGSVTIAAADVDAGSTDNCGIDSLSVTPSTFDCTNLGTETVTLTVFDNYGNTSSCPADVTVLDTVPPTAVCQDITVQLDAAGNVSIVAGQIDNGSSDVCGIAGISIDINDFDCSELGPNAVELLVEDNSGNTSTCQATVTVEDPVAPNAGCQNFTVYLDANGAVTADSVDADGGSTDNCSVASFMLSQTDFLCANLGQEIVTLTVEDGSGNTDDCIAVATVLDTISPIIVGCPADIQITANSNDCSPAVTWVEPTASDNCTPTLVSNFSSGDNFPVGSTTVTYDAEDQSGNTAACSFEVVVEPSELLLTLSSPTFTCGTNISCNGNNDGTVLASVSGGCEPYTYLWSNSQTSQDASGLSAGEYVLIVTDANGTEVSDTIVLTEPDAIVTDNISSPEFEGNVNISCAGAEDGAIDFSATGGADCQVYQYAWSGPNGYTSTDQSPVDLEAGQYSVTLTDVNGCVHQDNILLVQPDSIVTVAFPNSYNGFNVSCFGASDGQINLEVSGGTEGYSYLWSNGETTQDIDSLLAGQYDVAVTDTNGCVATSGTVLNEPPVLSVAVLDTIPIACNGTNSGQIEVTGQGGVPGYDYLWSNGDMDGVLGQVPAGQYQVLVSDQNGCQGSLSVDLTEPTALQVNVVQVTGVTCYDGSDGSVTIEANGGTLPYEYLWQPSLSNMAAATGLSGENQIYSVTDDNGCSVTDTVVVPEPDQMIITTSNDTTVCPGSIVELVAEVTGGGGTYLIDWEAGQGFGETYEAYYNQTANVSVTAVDQNGCEAIPNSVIVTTLQDVSAGFGFEVINQCTVPFQVDFNNESVNGSSFEWSFENGDSSNLFLPSTSFDTSGVFSVSLVATSDEGCTDTLNSTVTVDHLPVANFNIPNPEGCYPISVVHYNQSSNANSFQWDFGDGTGSDQSPAYHFYEDPGAYTVTLIASNDNGCSDTLAVDSAVFAFPRPVASFTPISTGSLNGDEFFMNNTTQGATDYFWLFGGSDFSELFEPTYTFPEHGGYDIILTASNQYGCEDTALVSVDIELIYGLFAPNAVATGEPGLAGRFQPIGTGLANYHVWVFDLWGNQLWESTALTNGSPAEAWDGRYKGKLVPQGAYSWKIEALFKNGVVWEGMPKPGGKPSTVGSVTVLH